MKTTITNSQCIDVCNRLLRGELSAVETYAQTIKKFEGDPAVSVLREIRSEHEQAAARLRENVLAMGGKPSTDSGAWGTFAEAVQSVAKMFGESAALSNLRRGEEHGIEDYGDALADDAVMPECKEMIRHELLPLSQRHVTTLEAMADVR